MPENKPSTNEEIRYLKKLSRKTRDSRMKTRYDAVRLNLEGRTTTEIAGILDANYYTVRNYLNSYAQSGISGLDITKPPGRTTKLTKEQEQEFYECITTKMPKDVGFSPFVNWTAPLASQWVFSKFGVKFSERGMRDVMYRLNLSYTCPTYVLKKADPLKQEAFKIDFEDVKKN